LRLIVLWLRRSAALLLGVLAVWFILFAFRITDHRLPWIVALAITYILRACGLCILPRVVRMSLKILQRRSVPSFTLTGDGFPGDPVNLVLVGNFQESPGGLRQGGLYRARSSQPQKLVADGRLRSSWRMAAAFVLNRPYPAAPFSTLYLFRRGRTSSSGGQDILFRRGRTSAFRRHRHEPAQAPSHPLLGLERGARRGDPEHARVLAQHRPPVA
jgi:hypothetical protein